MGADAILSQHFGKIGEIVRARKNNAAADQHRFLQFFDGLLRVETDDAQINPGVGIEILEGSPILRRNAVQHLRFFIRDVHPKNLS